MRKQNKIILKIKKFQKMPSKSLIHRKKKASTTISNEKKGLLERATILRFENSKFIRAIKILRKIC